VGFGMDVLEMSNFLLCDSLLPAMLQEQELGLTVQHPQVAVETQGLESAWMLPQHPHQLQLD